MFEKTITYNGAVITFHRATVRARLHARSYLYKLTLAGVDENILLNRYSEIELFIRFMTQATVEGELGFPLAAATDDPIAVKDSMEAFLDAPADFFDTVIQAGLETVDSPIADADLQPGADADPKKKTTPP